MRRRNFRASLGDEYIVAAIENNGGGDSALTVETVDNHIYFYATVDDDRCLDLIKQTKELDKKLIQERLSRNLPDGFPYTPIWLHINSPGGSPLSAFAVVDQFDKITSPVWSIAEGVTASAATLIYLACNKRCMQPNAYMLIHQLSSWSCEIRTYEQQRDDMDFADMLMNGMIKFYADHSNMTVDDVRKMLKRDSWMSAEKCIDLGLADIIL